MFIRTILAAFLIMLQAACASSSGSLEALPDSAGGAYKLGPGDEVRVFVQGFDSLTNTYVVSDEGKISLPLLGSTPVSGQSTVELERAVAQEMVRRELAVNPSVSIQVLKYRPFFILGEVQRPGQYPYVPGMSVLTAISIAGGHTFRADKKEYGISRNVDGTPVKGKAAETTVVQPGDTVIVYEAWF
jgi:polysaccharide biosynthesis/export protein